jgi:ribonuclease BN (tRNA processing enzyme)
VRYGGNTPCIEIAIGDHCIILDAGTGIIHLGNDLIRRAEAVGNAPITATLLLTHMHHDHTHGFPFFAPVLHASSTLNVLGPHTFEKKLDEVLHQVVLTPNFPVGLTEMPSLKMVYSLRARETILFDPTPGKIRIYNAFHDEVPHNPEIIRVRIHKSYAHPQNGVYIYRVEWNNRSMVFASDTEGYPDSDSRLIQFAKNTDLLIHDAQYTHNEYVKKRQGWGHSTPEMACHVALQANAKRLALFHHDPDRTDEQVEQMETEAQNLFPRTIAAYEGLEIEL